MRYLVSDAAAGAVIAALKAPAAEAVALAAPLPAKAKVAPHFSGIAQLPLAQRGDRIVTAIRRICHRNSGHPLGFVTVPRPGPTGNGTVREVTNKAYRTRRVTPTLGLERSPWRIDGSAVAMVREPRDA